MKPIKEVIVGSQAFFKSYSNFNPKDRDILCIMDSWSLCQTDTVRFHIRNDDVIFSRNMTKEEWIENTLVRKIPMRAGKFLVPDFIEFINFTILDLKKFENLFNNIDKKHSYEKIIYDAYLNNLSFNLTEQQRLCAFEEYRKSRQL